MTTVAQVAVVLQSMPPRVQSAVFDAIGPELAVPLIQAISAAAPNLNVDFACRELLADLLASHPEVLLPRLRVLLDQQPTVSQEGGPPLLLCQAFPEEADRLSQLADTELLRELPLRIDQLRREFTTSLKTRFLLEFPGESEPPEILKCLLHSHPQLVGSTLRDYLREKNRDTIQRRLQRVRWALASCSPAARSALEAKLEAQFPGLVEGACAQPDSFHTLKLLSKFLGAYPQACLALIDSHTSEDGPVWNALAAGNLAPHWINFILDHKHW